MCVCVCVCVFADNALVNIPVHISLRTLQLYMWNRLLEVNVLYFFMASVELLLLFWVRQSPVGNSTLPTCTPLCPLQVSDQYIAWRIIIIY